MLETCSESELIKVSLYMNSSALFVFIFKKTQIASGPSLTAYNFFSGVAISFNFFLFCSPRRELQKFLILKFRISLTKTLQSSENVKKHVFSNFEGPVLEPGAF